MSGLISAYLFIENDSSLLLLGIAIYFVFASIVKYILGLILFTKYKVFEECGEKAKDRSGTVDSLVDFEATDDALELLFYQEFNIKKHAAKLYGKNRPHSLLALAAYSSDKSLLFQAILNEAGVDQGLSDEAYKTALMTAFEFNVDKNMQIIAEYADSMTYNYLMQREEYHAYAALDYAIDDPDVESMTIFTKVAANIVKRQPDADGKMYNFLSNTWDGTALTRSIMWRNPLKCFQMLYELYPDSDKREALEIAQEFASDEDNLDIREFYTTYIDTEGELDQIKEFIEQELKKY